MPGKEDIFHSILIVSGSRQFTQSARTAIPGDGYISVEVKQNASAARRAALEKYYDIIIVNVPLPDESGMELSLDLAETSGASVVMAVPAEIFDDALDYVTDNGILVLPKPYPESRMEKAIRYLMAIQHRIRMKDKTILNLQEKAEELRIVTRAKFMLVEKKHMTEDEAHRLIGKQAMDHGISRKRAAERIIDDLE